MKDGPLARIASDGVTVLGKPQETEADARDLVDRLDGRTAQDPDLEDPRVEGDEVVAPPAEPAPQVINLMDALKASVEQVRKPEKPRRKMVASAKKPARRKRKTG